LHQLAPEIVLAGEVVAVGATVVVVGVIVVVFVMALVRLDRLVDVAEGVVVGAVAGRPAPRLGPAALVVVVVGVRALNPGSSATATCTKANELTLATTTAAAVMARTLLRALATSCLGPPGMFSVPITYSWLALITNSTGAGLEALLSFLGNCSERGHVGQLCMVLTSPEGKTDGVAVNSLAA
jgi:hypothetical protein